MERNRRLAMTMVRLAFALAVPVGAALWVRTCTYLWLISRGELVGTYTPICTKLPGEPQRLATESCADSLGSFIATQTDWLVGTAIAFCAIIALAIVLKTAFWVLDIQLPTLSTRRQTTVHCCRCECGHSDESSDQSSADDQRMIERLLDSEV